MKINNVLLLTIQSDDVNTSGIPIEVDYAKGNYPPLGLMYVAADLVKHGYNVKIFDNASFRKSVQELLLFIKRFNPEVIGVQLYSTSIRNAIKTLKVIKDKFPSLIIIAGGPHVDAYPKETISLPYFDVGILGEGGKRMVNVLKAIESGKPLKSIDGVVSKSNGKVSLHLPIYAANNFSESLFPLRDALENNNYCSIFDNKFTSIVASRGCHYSCIFCSEIAPFRVRKPDNVVSEIKHCVDKMGINSFYFLDSNFPAHINKWIKSFCEEIISSYLNISWSIRTRPDLLNHDSLKLMAKAGCKRLQLGIESANQESLMFLNKRLNLQLAEKNIKFARELGLTVLSYFIIGFPNEKRDDILNTLKYAKKTKSDFAHFSLLTPIPNTPLYKYVIDKSLIEKDYWLEYMNGLTNEHVPTISNHFSREELDDMLTEAYRYFYFDIGFVNRRILSLLKEKDRFSNLVKSINGLSSLLRM